MRFILGFFLFFIFTCTVVYASKSNTAVFSLKIKGLNVGTLSFLGTHDDNNYTISGELKSGGIFKFINKQRYKATTAGTLINSYFKPVIYTEHKNKKGVSRYSKDLKSMKVYKYLDTNLCLRVYSCTSSAEYKEFELKDKEKAYEYFADLFQKEIWEWGESTGNIK